MISKKLFLFIPSLIISFFACTNKGKMSSTVFFNENKTEIEVRSSCKISAFNPLENEEGLKQIISTSEKTAIKELKVKTTSSLEKAGYKITETKLIITERCGAKTPDGMPFIVLQHILTLVNTKSGESTTFRADTLYQNQQALNQPKTIVPKKIVLDSYLPGLSKKNIIAVKNFLTPKK
ncbi:MAG TPA: hypothetical protein VGF30_03170 [Bacteroidia bacterium]